MALEKTGPRAVIVDFFNTLVEIDEDVPRSWELLEELGFRSSPELEAIWSPDGFDGSDTPAGPLYESWRRFLLARHVASAGVPSSLRDSVVQRLIDNDRTWTVKAKAGAGQFLEILRKNAVGVVICSNWDYDLEIYLRQAGLPADIASVCSWQVGARKPSPKIFTSALGMIEAEPGDAVVVGDSVSSDIAGALRLEIPAIWVTEELHHPIARLAAVTVVPSLLDAARAIVS